MAVYRGASVRSRKLCNVCDYQLSPHQWQEAKFLRLQCSEEMALIPVSTFFRKVKNQGFLKPLWARDAEPTPYQNRYRLGASGLANRIAQLRFGQFQTVLYCLSNEQMPGRPGSFMNPCQVFAISRTKQSYMIFFSSK